MNNNTIFELDKEFNFDILNLGNPTLINNNNYSCKISHGKTDKNLYIQLPKCSTKQGIVKTASKTYADLNFCMSNKKAINFFEKLEKYSAEQIYINRDAWLADTENMSKNDIEFLMQSTTRPFKQGKSFLVKVHINPDKLKIYDENENKIDIDDINDACEFIPLVNINNVKFSTKNFSIDIILTQMMVILPSEDFEKQVLIKVDTKKQPVNIPQPDPEPVVETMVEPAETPKPETLDDTPDLNTDFEIECETTIDDSYDVDNDENDDDDESVDDSETYVRKPLIIEEIIEEETPDMNLEVKPEPLIVAPELIPEPVFELVTPTPDPVEEPPVSKSLINSDLETIDLINISETTDNSVELKSHEEIYLEIYNTAKQKARDIRKNAITAFLEAKNIKKLYNLEELDIDSSDDEEDFMNFDQ
jgi:hypothetical protein